MWDKAPHCDIMIDDKSYFNGAIDGTEDKPNLIEFEHECEEDKEHTLTIHRSGKSVGQTVVNEKGDILQDQLLDIGALVYEGVYTPEYPEPWATQQKESGQVLKESFTNVTKMGHNGTWKLKFTSPFYMWLLDNLY